MTDRRLGHTIIWVLFLISIGGVIAINLMGNPPLTNAQARNYNFLNNSLYDFDHPTKENETIRSIECTDYATKARDFLSLPRKDVREKVKRFVQYCETNFPRE